MRNSPSLSRITLYPTFQIDTIQLLVQGRVREREQRLRRAAAAFQGAAQAFGGRASLRGSDRSSVRGSTAPSTLAARRLSQAVGVIRAGGDPPTMQVAVEGVESRGPASGGLGGLARAVLASGPDQPQLHPADGGADYDRTHQVEMSRDCDAVELSITAHEVRD